MMPRQANGGTAEPSTLLIKMRHTFLFCWTFFFAEEAFLQADFLYRGVIAAHHLSVIGPACLIVGFVPLAILGLYNLVYLRNPKSRLYLFRWMST